MAAPTPPVVPLPALRSDPATFKDRAEGNIVFFQPLVEYMAEVCGFTEDKAAEALAAALAGDLPNISGKDGRVLYITGGGLGFKLVQTGVHDDTTNALMPVGAFGLGQKGSTTTVTLNGTTRTGFYNYGATDPDRPVAITTGGSFIAVRYATNWISQIIFAPNANLVFYRYTTDNGVTWSAWTRIMLATDIATTGQALAGENTDVLMSPKRTKQAIDAFSPVKAHVNFDGAGSSPTWVKDSKGVSSVTDLGVGSYQINLATPMSSIWYNVLASCRSEASGYFATPHTTGGINFISRPPTVNDFTIAITDRVNNPRDSGIISVIVVESDL